MPNATATAPKTDETFTGDYEIKGINNFKGHEGEPCAQGSIYCKGKKIGYFSQSPCGGEDQIEFTNKADENAFNNLIKSLPAVPFMGIDLDVSAGMFIGRMVDKYDTIQQEKKWCRKETLFTTPKTPKGEYQTIKHPYCQKVVEYIMKKYPDATIINAKYQTIK